MVLPAMGVVSEIIPCFARSAAIFGYRFHGLCHDRPSPCIGFFVWGHHMFVSGPVALSQA